MLIKGKNAVSGIVLLYMRRIVMSSTIRNMVNNCYIFQSLIGINIEEEIKRFTVASTNLSSSLHLVNRPLLLASVPNSKGCLRS
jgi:hypothetical protein